MTWSIVAHDPNSGAFAVAVATKAFAVGASCPFVRSGVGAVSTQSMTNRYLGPAILDALNRQCSGGQRDRVVNAVDWLMFIRAPGQCDGKKKERN